MSVFIIAEAGVNHNGSIEIAKNMIDVAKNAGVDAIKFQTFISEKLVSKTAVKADYQKKNTGDKGNSQLEMLKELELSFNQFAELKKYCDERDIIFLSTAFDFDSIDFLSSIDMMCYKIPSGEITNLPYLERIAKTGKKIILSTGMSTLDEIADAILILRKNGAKRIALMHCTTEYPAPYEEINLKAIKLLSEKFNLEVGYSDHTEGIVVPVAAVALGATIIEKHFTLDRTMSGPDHKASLMPNELEEMVKAIRVVEKSLGEEQKEPSKSELKNIDVARKSIVATRKIKKGEIITADKITAKRPGDGISPMKWYDVIGQYAVRDFEEDEKIEL